MAYQASRSPTTAAKGDAANTGMMKTPAPVRPDPPDEVTNIRRPSPPGYGMSHPGDNPSSIDPGRQKLSPLAANLKASSEAPKGLTLDHIIQHGTARDSSVDLMSSQTRPYDSDQKVPTTFGHRNVSDPAKAAKVPSTTGHSPMADELRRRQQALLRAAGK